jgi:hypothetical protein
MSKEFPDGKGGAGLVSYESDGRLGPRPVATTGSCGEGWIAAPVSANVRVEGNIRFTLPVNIPETAPFVAEFVATDPMEAMARLFEPHVLESKA